MSEHWQTRGEQLCSRPRKTRLKNLYFKDLGIDSEKGQA